MIKLKLTAVYEYEPIALNYPSAESAEEMAKVDEENSYETLMIALENEDKVQVTIEPV